MKRGFRHAWRAAALVLLAAAEGAAQNRLAVMEERDATAVGIAVVLNAGGPWEMDAETGATHLAALAVVEQVRSQLELLGGRLRVECLPAATMLTLLLPPTTWRLGTLLFLDALFEQRLSVAAIETAREGLLRSLGAQDEFTDTVRAALSRALFGEGHRWTRPPCGRAETIAALGVEDVHRIRRARFRPTRAAAAVAGPVSKAEALEVFSRLVVDDALPLLAPAPADGAWDGHVHVAARTVTTWVALAFPFASGTDTEALELLGFRIREALGPSPQRPDVFDIRTRVERHGDGGWFEVSLVTAPASASKREAEARALIRESGRKVLPDEAFDGLLRRFRGARLHELAAPEARARAAVLQLFFDRTFQWPAARSGELTPGRLRRAADALGGSASASFGPR